MWESERIQHMHTHTHTHRDRERKREREIRGGPISGAVGAVPEVNAGVGDRGRGGGHDWVHVSVRGLCM